MFYSIPVDGTCDKTVDGCKDVGDTGDDDDDDENSKVSFVSKNKYLFRLCRVSREKKIGNVLSLTITRHFLNQTPSFGLRHPSLGRCRKVMLGVWSSIRVNYTRYMNSTKGSS